MTQVKVYRYGLLPPEVGADVVRAQMRAAHVYRNRLIEIGRKERAEVRAAQSSHGPVRELEVRAREAAAVREAAYQAVTDYKATNSTREVPRKLRLACQSARAAESAAKKALREVRKATREDAEVKARKDAAYKAGAEARRHEAASAPVYCCTREVVDESAEQSFKKTPLWDGVDPNDPRFVRWDGSGTVAVRDRDGGIPVSDLGAGATLFRLAPRAAPPGSDPLSARSAKRSYMTLSMRVTGGREPVWAEWPMVMHRPLPLGGVIKGVRVTVRRIGPREEWAALFTVHCEDKRQRPPAEPSNRVALDIGWRRLPDGGLRVATWLADDGTGGRLDLPARLVGALAKGSEIGSVRKRSADAARDALVARVRAGLPIPDWFPRNVWQWKSTARLAALARRWRDNRFDGDADAYAELEAWRYHDHHLWAWETSQVTKAQRWRREVYRRFAANLAGKCTGLVLEDFDLRDVAEKSAPDERHRDNDTANSQRHMAAVSDLRHWLINAFGEERVVKADPAWTTKRCHACGKIDKWDDAGAQEHTCSGCGQTWDRDENAARNLLRYQAPPKAAPAPRETRWERVKRLREEKAAREEVPMAAE